MHQPQQKMVLQAAYMGFETHIKTIKREDTTDEWWVVRGSNPRQMD